MSSWKTLMRPHLQVYESASRSFQETRELLSRVESARGYFPVIGIGSFDALAQPSPDRRPAKSLGKGKKGKRNRNSSSQKSGKSTWHLDKTTDLTFRVSESPTEAGATRGGPHHAPHFRPDQFMLCRQIGHRASDCPNKGKRLHFHLANRHLVPMLWAVRCSMPRVMVQLSKKPNKIKTRMTSKTLLRFQSRVWRGSQFFTEEPRRPFPDSWVFKQ